MLPETSSRNTLSERSAKAACSDPHEDVVDEQPADELSAGEDDSGLLYSFIIIAGINVVLVVIGGGVLFYLRKKKTRDEFDLMDDNMEAASND